MTIAKRACLLVLCVAALTACAESTPDATPPVQDEAAAKAEDAAPLDPAAQGLADARAAIAAGKPRILSYGMPDFGVGEMDPRTGVRYGYEGCEVSDEGDAHAAAYNAEIRRAVEAGELAGVELRHKVTTRGAMVKRFEADRGREVSLESGPAPAPGGRFSVEVALHPEYEEATLWVVDSETGSRREMCLLDFERGRVLFSEDGETLFVHHEQSDTYQTYDLPTALFMQGWEGAEEEIEDDE